MQRILPDACKLPFAIWPVESREGGEENERERGRERGWTLQQPQQLVVVAVTSHLKVKSRKNASQIYPPPVLSTVAWLCVYACAWLCDFVCVMQTKFEKIHKYVARIWGHFAGSANNSICCNLKCKCSRLRRCSIQAAGQPHTNTLPHTHTCALHCMPSCYNEEKAKRGRRSEMNNWTATSALTADCLIVRRQRGQGRAEEESEKGRVRSRMMEGVRGNSNRFPLRFMLSKSLVSCSLFLAAYF